MIKILFHIRGDSCVVNWKGVIKGKVYKKNLIFVCKHNLDQSYDTLLFVSKLICSVKIKWDVDIYVVGGNKRVKSVRCT